MKIERNELGNTMVIRLEGDLDERAVDGLRKALYACICEGQFNVVLNLSKVGFVSYMCLGVIVERLRRFRAVKGDIKLVGVNTYMERLFRMVGVTTLFETYEEESEAVSGYQQAA
jgi:stage II sporulation protein AA (anti-sigma F factor antagonist)